MALNRQMADAIDHIRTLDLLGIVLNHGNFQLARYFRRFAAHCATGILALFVLSEPANGQRAE